MPGSGDDAATRPRRLATARFALIAILFLTLIGVEPFTDWAAPIEDSEGNPLRQLAFVALMIFVVAGSDIWGSYRRLAALPAAMLALFAYCLLSVSWAVDPGVSLRRLALTVIVAWTVFRVVSELGYPTTLRLVRRFLLAMLAVNFCVVAFTSFGTHGYISGQDPGIIGDWRGILPHKNIAGAVCAFTIIVFLFDRRNLHTYQTIGAVTAAAVFLFFSHAKTSEGMLLIALATGTAIRAYSANYRVLLLLCAALVLVIGAQMLLADSNAILGVLADPTSFTGRSQIWPVLLDYAADHPWTGAGFASFWQIGPASPILEYTSGWARDAGHGHNGYLDLLVTIGAPGLALAIFVLFAWPLARLLFSATLPKPRRSLLVAMMVFAAGHNFTETSLLSGDAVVETFLLLTIALIYQQSNRSGGRHHELRRRFWRLVRQEPLRAPPRRRASVRPALP